MVVTTDGELLVAHLIGRIGYSGTPYLGYAVEIVCQILKETGSVDGINMIESVYRPVAERFGKKVATTSRKIYRAIDCCWSKGDKEAINQIIGKPLPQKPPSREFILYCAYYLCYGVGYLSEEARYGNLPMIF